MAISRESGTSATNPKQKKHGDVLNDLWLLQTALLLECIPSLILSFTLIFILNFITYIKEKCNSFSKILLCNKAFNL